MLQATSRDPKGRLYCERSDCASALHGYRGEGVDRRSVRRGDNHTLEGLCIEITINYKKR